MGGRWSSASSLGAVRRCAGRLLAGMTAASKTKGRGGHPFVTWGGFRVSRAASPGRCPFALRHFRRSSARPRPCGRNACSRNSNRVCCPQGRRPPPPLRLITHNMAICAVPRCGVDRERQPGAGWHRAGRPVISKDAVRVRRYFRAGGSGWSIGPSAPWAAFE
jgi:hypothetical protein